MVRVFFYFYIIISSIIVCFIIRDSVACEITDDLGNHIILARPAQRIISLAPDLTEILFAVGAGKKIVGVVKGSDYPLAAKNIPVMASYNSIELEKTLSLHPDFIVAWAEESYLPSLKKLGIPIYISQQKKIIDIANTMKQLGCAAGTEKTANLLAKQYLQHYQRLQKKYSHQKSLTVFYQVWPKPLMTVTKNSWMNDVIELCGGTNIFANIQSVTPEITIESVIAADPDVIIGTDVGQNWLPQWEKWPELKAVKKQAIFMMHAELIERASPRILDGVEEMCQLLFAKG